jgi:hypothetical protein
MIESTFPAIESALLAVLLVLSIPGIVLSMGRGELAPGGRARRSRPSGIPNLIHPALKQTEPEGN